MSSPEFDSLSVMEDLKAFSTVLGKRFERGDGIKETLSRFFPQASHLKNFSMNVKLQRQKLLIQNLEFEVMEGRLGLNGEVIGSTEKPNFSLGLHLERISLARYFEGVGQADKALEGNLFFTGKFHGQGKTPEEILPSLSGEGSLSITNGAWRDLDLMSPFKNLTPFQDLPLSDLHSLSFYDLKADWKLKEGKFNTQNLILNTEDFWIEGQGNLSTKGVLNSRLEVYLSQSLTKQAFQLWRAPVETEGKQLGPIPLLIVGSIMKPESRIDDRLVESLLEAIRTQKFRKVLRRPFLGK